MSRKKAPRLVEDKNNEFLSGNTFELAGKEFKVVAFEQREDDKSYDDSVDFAVRAIPIVMKIYSVAGTLDAFNVFDAASSPVSSEVLNEFGLVDTVKQLANELPELVAIVCHATDSGIDAAQVKKMAKSILNTNLIKAVFLQFKAESLGSKLTELKGAAEDVQL